MPIEYALKSSDARSQAHSMFFGAIAQIFIHCTAIESDVAGESGDGAR
jgi:hypothetical protein